MGYQNVIVRAWVDDGPTLGGGRPDNSLPGQPVYPSQGLPVYPDNSLPGGGNFPSQGLPGGGNFPSQGLPGGGNYPSQGLPGGGNFPSQGLPGTPMPHAVTDPGPQPQDPPNDDGQWIVAVAGSQAAWVWLPTAPMPDNTLPGGSSGNKPNQDLPPHAQPKK
jgi:hypothetical protein